MFFWNSLAFSMIQPVDVGNLISGSSAFSKTSLNIWKFMVHVLLKPGLENIYIYMPTQNIIYMHRQKAGINISQFWQMLTIWKIPKGLCINTVHGILQARILEWVAIAFSRGSSWPRNQTGVSCIASGFFTSWAIKETHKENSFCERKQKPVKMAERAASLGRFPAKSMAKGPVEKHRRFSWTTSFRYCLFILY